MAGKKNGTRNGTERTAPTPDPVVMTLRFSAVDREKLHRYSLRLSKREGRRISYNAAMIELIREHARP